MFDPDGRAEEHRDKEYWASDEGKYWIWAERAAKEECEVVLDFMVLTDSAAVLGSVLQRAFPRVWEKHYPIFSDSCESVLGFDFHADTDTVSIWADYEGSVPIFKISQTGDNGERVITTHILRCDTRDSVNAAASLLNAMVGAESNA